MSRTSTRRWLAAAATSVCAAGAGISVAVAAPAPDRAPGPVPVSDFRLVVSDVEILSDAGEVLRRHHCEWTEPQADDRPCLAFSGDPQKALASIREAGGAAADVHVVSEEIGLDALTTIRRRGNGQWLFRGRGEGRGRTFDHGHLCSADGESCTRWDAAGARSAKKAVRAAAARLRARS